MDNRIIELKQRRAELDKELAEVVTEIVTTELKQSLKEIEMVEDAKILSVSWEFYPESDDEGGSYYYPTGVYVELEGDLDADELKAIQRYGDNEYEYDLNDIVNEVICEYSTDLYKYDIDEISLED